MQQPWGQWLVGAIGVAVIIAGIAHAVRGYKGRFMRRLRVSRGELGALYNVSRFGLIARGVVFVIVGSLLIQAAMQHDPSEAGGLRGAFHQILQQPYGVALLAIVGVGLLSFAVYSVIEGRYRRIAPP